MNALVGYTGFVGSNLYMTGDFDKVYNSKNVEMAYGTKPDVLVYAGVRAEKYLANNFPEKDNELIKQAQHNIRAIQPKKLVLISTIDVLDDPIYADEDAEINSEKLQQYGLSRYKLEQWAKNEYSDSLIIRLPALFGKNIKKNFIYDYINVIPFMLKADKFMELMERNSDLGKYYEFLENGFYRCRILSQSEKSYLRKMFADIGFTALNFTDSRSVFQFYPLARLWSDIKIALVNNLSIWHAATEPVSASEIYYHMTGDKFLNELGGMPFNYDYRSKYAEIFGGKEGYICDKQTILDMIEQFVNDEIKNNHGKGGGL